MKSFLKLSGGLFLAAFTAMAMAETKPAPIVQATPLPDHQVSFEVNGREWTRAHFGHGLKRPFLYPVIGPSGRTLTRMGHPRDPVSHSHHNSVWLSHAKVNNVDFWSDSGTGRIVHQRLEKLTDGDDDASATTFNLWIDEAKHQTLLAERRRVTVLPKEGGAALIVIDSQLEAKTDVVFGKTPFGFLGVRMAKSIGVRDGGGTIRNSAGGIDEKGVLWKAAKWVDYSGAVTRDVKRLEGIALFDHPQNPNHPSVFHVRDDGWMGASFSFAAPVELAKGKTLRLRYGLYVHDTLTSAALEACWREFAKSKLDDLVSRTPSPTIEVVAGGGTAVEGKPATECKISQPFGIAFDSQDNMFVCEESHRLLRVDAKTGVLTVVAAAKRGDAPLGDGGPVADASFIAPHNLVADGQGNLFVADTGHRCVRRVDAKTGIVTLIAGTGATELSGDGGPATKAGLDGVACLCFNHDFSKLYLGGFSKAIRVVDMKTGTIETVKGIVGSRAQAVDSKGNVFIPAGRGVRMLSPDGKRTLLEDAGAKPLNAVKHLWADRDDNLVIADEGNNLIRKFLVKEKKLLTIAGTGERGTSGVPGPALKAQLAGPHGVVTHPRTGDIYIADSRNHRVLRIKVVGNGQRVFSCGHSFHNGFASLFEEIAKSAGFKDHATVGKSGIGGSKVIQHWGGKEVQAALKDGVVDVLTTTPIYLPDPGIEKFAQLGLEHNPNFRLTMMEFWLPYDQYEPRHYSHGPKDSPTEHVKPPKNVDHNVATGDGLRKLHKRYFEEMDALVLADNKKLGKPVVFVVPVGQAVIALREKTIAGEAPGLKSQEDLFSDGLGHPRPTLQVLMTYCHYAAIYRKSPVGLPVPKELAKAKDAEALNRLLQELAWDAVVHHRLSGVTQK